MRRVRPGDPITVLAPFAVIFDMDGVLVDSEPLQLGAWIRAAADFGIHLDAEEFVQRVTLEGLPIRALFERRGGNPAEYDRVFIRKTEIYSTLVHNELRLMPGAIDLLSDLKTSSIPRALATSASRVSMDLVFAAHDLAGYFDATVTYEDVTRLKPDPEPFLQAAMLLRVPPERCIVVEDAPKGLTAAKAADMRCIIIPTPLSQSEDLSAADLVVESLEQLSMVRLATLIEEHV